MKKVSNAGISRFENHVSSAIMLFIVLLSLSIFAAVAWQLIRFLLSEPIF